MARKVRGFERVLDAPALFAVAYGEIGSPLSIPLRLLPGGGRRPPPAAPPVAAALSVPDLRDAPWDVFVAVVVIAVIAGARLLRRARLHRAGLAIALLDLAVQTLVIVLGLAFLFSPETLTDGLSLAQGQSWSDLLF